MHMTSSLPFARRRSSKRSKTERNPGEDRTQRANASQDAALYTCSCGYIFKAAVTTSVGCPHCGNDQAW
jgi:rubrerythrin